MAYDEVLAGRVRERLAGRTEKPMFGIRAFLTDGNLTVCVQSDGLLVRLGPESAARAVAEPGVRLFDMGGRPMKGWVLVATDRLDDAGLDAWLAAATEFVATLPAKR
jgi:hypothetical protein